MLKARYTMIGGFLGAGKTTAIQRIGKTLSDKGVRVGLITNDQSVGLVDTAMLAATSLPTEEIVGGCFCCRFNSLVDAAGKLSAEASPDVFLAEPVGSCTDLQATVSVPLRRLYGDRYEVSPLSVLVDPIRAQRVLGQRPGKTFSPKVNYIYRKQLEEADLIVINKCDLLEPQELDRLEDGLRGAFPESDVLRVSARSGQGFEAWLAAIGDGANQARAMQMDYDTYAEGEALLGWVNVSAGLEGAPFDGNAFVAEAIAGVGARLSEAGVHVAHLKATLSPSTGRDLAVGNLVRDDAAAELSHQLAEPLAAGELLVNLRAEGDPDELKEIVLDLVTAIASQRGVQTRIQHAEAFRPAPPKPTHRFVAGPAG